MSIKNSVDKITSAITESNVKTETITKGLRELIKALDAEDQIKPTDDTISEYLDIVARVLPDKMGITPTGTIEITENGIGIDVTQYASADVAVPQPSGKITITENGTNIDIADYATADVNIEQEITVSESYDISEGTLNTATVYLVGDVTATIPDGVTTIGAEAFNRNLDIRKVIMPDTVTELATIQQYGTYHGPFENCYNLREVIFSQNLLTIGGGAFSWCESLTSATIPDSVTSIGANAFTKCTSLESVTIPDSVTNMDNGVFTYCTSLTSIVFPSSITVINNNMCYECSSLISAVIPDSVTEIKVNAFNNCPLLTDIYYTGTQAEWEAITKGNNAIPAGATIHYEYTP